MRLSDNEKRDAIKFLQEGKIPSFKAGGQWRFRKDEINAWSKGANRKQKT